MADSSFKTPEVDWRTLNGAKVDEFGRKLPPGIITEWSTSESDMRRRSFRQSMYPNYFTQAHVNDDGTPIAAETNSLLSEVVVGLNQLREEMAALNAKFQLLLDME